MYWINKWTTVLLTAHFQMYTLDPVSMTNNMCFYIFFIYIFLYYMYILQLPRLRCFDISWTEWFILIIIVRLIACENSHQKKTHRRTGRAQRRLPAPEGWLVEDSAVWSTPCEQYPAFLLSPPCRRSDPIRLCLNQALIRQGTLALQSSRLYTWGQRIQVSVLQG